MRRIFVNKTKSFKNAQDFSVRFWDTVKTSVKFEALWEMVKEFNRIKGKSEDKPRLQRSIQNIKRA